MNRVVGMKTKILAVTLILISLAFTCTSKAIHSNANPSLEQKSTAIEGTGLLKPVEAAEITFFGMWKIAKVAGYGRVSAGEEVGRKSLGEKVSFAPDEAVIANKQIKPVYYYKISVSQHEFFMNNLVQAEHLGMVGPMVHIIVVSPRERLHKANWRSEYDFVIKDEKSILINCENVWFELIRENGQDA